MPDEHPRSPPGLLHIEAGNIGSEKVSILFAVFDFSRPTVISGPSREIIFGCFFWLKKL